ncbi:MAG: aminopeptidase [Treponema sp.]|jgi:leucyl aminopeptidase (aminopeptidase T)|nr:aminopeptidase [Treponema sp.]
MNGAVYDGGENRLPFCRSIGHTVTMEMVQEPAAHNEALHEAARIACSAALKLRKGEQVLIITNPKPSVEVIARALYSAALDCGASPVLMFQPVKTQFDFAEPAVIAAFQARPQAVISISAEKLGKDRRGIAEPYKHEGIEYDHLFHLLMYGEKSCRAFWSPGVTPESFIRTVPIDYAGLGRRCAAVSRVLSAAESARITAPGGTDITVGLRGREAKPDDGDFSQPGRGGNLPAGESFISPENGTAEGVIVFDGSISLHKGDIIIREPVRCEVRAGYVTNISGGNEARALLETITAAERDALEYEKTGRLPKGQGAVYAKNARNIGELGIGLNPKAQITGGMLEDEKAFRTCHFAIGHNYDNDAPSLIHLDGLVREPTITARLADPVSPGKAAPSLVVIERDGELVV